MDGLTPVAGAACHRGDDARRVHFAHTAIQLVYDVDISRRTHEDVDRLSQTGTNRLSSISGITHFSIAYHR